MKRLRALFSTGDGRAMFVVAVLLGIVTGLGYLLFLLSLTGH